MLPEEDPVKKIDLLKELLEKQDATDAEIQELLDGMGPAEARLAWARSDGRLRAPYLPLVREHGRQQIQRFGSYTADVLATQIKAFDWSIGEKTYGHPLILEPSLGKLTIGRYCSLADSSIILGNHKTRTATTYPFMTLWFDWPGTYVGLDDHSSRDVVIGNDVWIGHQAIILPGARIGDGSIVGAGAVVGGIVPPYSIVVGNPGRVRTRRFSDSIIEDLLRIQWWDWPDATVDRYIPLLLSENLLPLLEAVRTDPEFSLPA